MSQKIKDRKTVSQPSCGELVIRRQTRRPKTVAALHLLFRYAVAVTAVYGTGCLVRDALSLSVGTWELLLPSLLFTAVFYLAFSSFKGFAAGILTGIVSLVIMAAANGRSLVGFLYGGGVYFWNRLMMLLDARNFVAAPPIAYAGQNVEGVIAAVALIAALLFSLCTRKRTASGLVLLLSLAMAAPLYFCRLSYDVKSVLPLLCAVCGAVAMRISEKQSGDRESAGVVGLTALLLAMAVLLSPVGSIEQPWKEYPRVANVGQALAKIVSDLSAGKTPNLGWGTTIPAPEERRSAAPSPRIYYGKVMMTVYSQINKPIYLRTWVGGEYEEESWHPVEYAASGLVMGEYAAGLDPYDFFEGLFHAYQGTGMTDVLTALGYRYNAIGISLEEAGTTLPMPPLVTGLPTVEGTYIGSSSVYDGVVIRGANYSDGVYHVTSLVRSYYGDEAAAQMRELLRGYLQYTEDSPRTELSEDASEYARLLLERYGVYGLVAEKMARDSYRSFLDDAYGDAFADSAIDRAVHEIFDQTDIEKYYAKYGGTQYLDTALSITDNGTIRRREEGAIVEYRLKNDSVVYIDEIAALVADYLRQNCRYTLVPATNGDVSVMEDFLFDSKEGYCVQFATAGTLILRKLGFDARYAEGYIAKEFEKNTSEQVEGTYRSTIYDRNAHAWTEVWVDGLGWLQYEMTPVYYELMNQVEDPLVTTEPVTTDDLFSNVTTEPPETDVTEPSASTSEGPQILPITTDKATAPATTEPTVGPADGNAPDKGNDNTALAVGLLIVIFLTAAISVLHARSEKRRKRRRRLIDHAMAGGPSDPDEQAALSAALTEELTAVLHAYGILPKEGEQPSDFGARLDTELASLGLAVLPSQGIKAMASRIYRGAMTPEELKAAAAVLDALCRKARGKLGLVRFTCYRMKGIL